MAWGDVDPAVRAAAEKVCTEKELEALRLVASGYGLKRAAFVLGISRSSLRNRISNAERKVLNEIEKGEDRGE